MEEIRNLVLELINQTETVINRGLDDVYIATTLKVNISGKKKCVASGNMPRENLIKP